MVEEDLEIPDVPRRAVFSQEEVPRLTIVRAPAVSRSQAASEHDSPVDLSPTPPRMNFRDDHETPLNEDVLTDIAPSAVLSTSRTAPPSYRPLASVSGSIHRRMGQTQIIHRAAADDMDTDLDTSRGTAGGRRSYKLPSSNARRK